MVIGSSPSSTGWALSGSAPETATDDPGRGPGPSVRVLENPVTGAPGGRIHQCVLVEPRVATRATSKRWRLKTLHSHRTGRPRRAPRGGASAPGPPVARGPTGSSMPPGPWRTDRHRRKPGVAVAWRPAGTRGTPTPSGMGVRTSFGAARAASATAAQTEPVPVRVRPVTSLTTTTAMIAPIIGDDDRADVERAVDRLGVEQDAGQEAADQCADDAEDDVPDDAESLVTLDEEAGQIAGDRAEDDPRDDAHSNTSIPSGPRARVPGVRSIPKPGTRDPLSLRRIGGGTTFARSRITTGCQRHEPRPRSDLQSICDVA